MIFRDLLIELKDEVSKAVNELFAAAFANQTHPNDLLLVDQHGLYDQLIAESPAGREHRLSPYVIGPHFIGFAEQTFYEFIDFYRQSHLLDSIQFSETLTTNDEARQQEELTLQLEQSIYLRFWESDLILKQLHQLSSLATGKPYDWHLKIPVHARDGSRQDIIRKEIRDRIKGVCPQYYGLLKDTYSTQIRNAIAHSQFYILGRSIRFLNHSPDLRAHCPLSGMNFDEWYQLFHKILLLHSEVIGAFARYRSLFRKMTLAQGNRIQVRITEMNGRESFTDLGMLHDRDEWVWWNNLNEQDRRRRAG